MSLDSMDPNKLVATLYAIVILILVYTYLSRKRYHKLMNQFPSTMQLPILGIFHRMLTPRKIITQFREVLTIYKTNSVVAFFGPVPGFFTIDTVLLEKIFTSPNFYNKPEIIYGTLRDLFGDGIFTAKRAKWQRNRKLISPSFRKPVLRMFLPIFNKNTIKILKPKLDAMIGNGERPLLDIVQRFALTTAMETVLGNEMDPGTELDQQVIQNYFIVLRSSIFNVLFNVFNLSRVVKFFGFYKTRDAVFDFVTGLVNKRVQRHQRKTDINDNNEIVADFNADADSNETRNIFIDQVLKSYDRNLLQWGEVLEESNSIIFAAFETTATTIFYTLAFIAMHPDIQDKLFEHVKSIYLDKEFEVDFEHADDYDYMNMAILETLRHVPPVPAIAREASEDTQLTEDIFLHKGMVVLINILETQMDPKIWGPDAHKYNPDNFSPENVNSRTPYAFLAFSRGMRNCVGAKYAVIAIKVVLFHLIRNYHFTTSFKFEDLEFENNIIIRAKRVPLLEIHKRVD